MREVDTSKRTFIKTAAYVAPVVLTLSAMPSIASAGSCNQGGGNGPEGCDPAQSENANQDEP